MVHGSGFRRTAFENLSDALEVRGLAAATAVNGRGRLISVDERGCGMPGSAIERSCRQKVVGTRRGICTSSIRAMVTTGQAKSCSCMICRYGHSLAISRQHLVKNCLTQRSIFVFGEQAIGVCHSQLVEPRRQLCRGHDRCIGIGNGGHLDAGTRKLTRGLTESWNRGLRLLAMHWLVTVRASMSGRGGGEVMLVSGSVEARVRRAPPTSDGELFHKAACNCMCTTGLAGQLSVARGRVGGTGCSDVVVRCALALMR